MPPPAPLTQPRVQHKDDGTREAVAVERDAGEAKSLFKTVAGYGNIRP